MPSNKFIDSNKSEILRNWLANVDLSDANISSVEQQIMIALQKSISNNLWHPQLINPFSDPINLDELLGDFILGSNGQITYNAKRLDSIFEVLSDVNNTLKSDLDTLDKVVLEATDQVNKFNLALPLQNIQYFWINDNFNNNLFVDPKKSTVLVDTDYSQVTLATGTLDVITDYKFSIDHGATNGIPGANLIVVDPGQNGTASLEPIPILEATNTRTLTSLSDSDPTTWFEIERNFILPTQKVIMEGRAYTYSQAGQPQDIKAITNNLDWKAIIKWDDGLVQDGGDGNGLPIAEFVDASTIKDNIVAMKLVATFQNSVPLTAIKILPFVRSDASPINIDLISVLIDNIWVDIAKDVVLGSNVATTKLANSILNRTGTSNVGSIYTIPTSRPITAISFSLSSKPYTPQYGFGHIFQDVLTAYRTERNYIFFNSVDHWTAWGRIAFNTTAPTLTVENGGPKIIGAITGAANAANSIISGVQSLVPNAAKTSVLGSALGSIGTWLGAAAPYIGGILALNALVGGIFHVDKSATVTDSRRGYDIFTGMRSAIAIRDISFIRSEYVSNSTLYSVKRSFPANVTKVALFVDEKIPESWGSGQWISYYVSEDGNNWVPIKKLVDNSFTNAYVPKAPIRDIYFRADFVGNPSDPFTTPELNNYTLQGLPA
jgi:hypothetical protein